MKEDYKKGVLRNKRLRRDSVESNFSIAPIENATVQQWCTAAKSLKFPNFPTTFTSSGFEPFDNDDERSALSEGCAGHLCQAESISLNTQESPRTPLNEGLFISPPPPSLHLTSMPITANQYLPHYRQSHIKAIYKNI